VIERIERDLRRFERCGGQMKTAAFVKRASDLSLPKHINPASQTQNALSLRRHRRVLKSFE
jgi:hypothetical protein